MLVGIAGRKQHGKNTVAQMICEDYPFQELTFAAPIKMAVANLFGWEVEMFEDGEWKDTPQELCYGKSPRDLLLSLGTEWGRDMVSKNIWRDMTMRHAEYLHRAFKTHGVIPDVRFDGEAQAIKERGGFIIHVVRLDAPEDSSVAHVTEQGISHKLIDFNVFVKTGELAILRRLVREFMDTRFSRREV